jgi:UDP-N-acetylglucosamine diphosphorylase / glucose-1-phosphate thymidylyltransferase / UDP-N-acetylgalactosamine diphosphorylase / glucosamine-1-phosphate N-acetyltransferase / galactosamine-1-phosphate N-acetyltransferase
MKTAILLAAGKGGGAWPFCGIRQKVTMPVCNTPMIRRLALQCRNAGFEEVVVVTGHRAGAVRACLGDLDFIHFVNQPASDGPVEAARTGLEAGSGEDVLIACGDIVTTEASLIALLGACEKDPGAAALLGAEYDGGLHHWISLETGADRLLEGIHPCGGPDHLRFGGMALARRATIRRYFERDPGMMTSVHVGAMPPLESCLAAPFDVMRQEGIPVHCVTAPAFLVDVDRPWQIMEANRCAAAHFFSQLQTTHIAPGAHVDDSADIAEDAVLYLEEGARIGRNAVVRGPVRLGPGAVIDHGAIMGQHCVLGEKARLMEYGKLHDGAIIGAHSAVGHCAEFGGVALDGVLMHHYCCVTALIGTHADIGAATVCGTWRFDNGIRGQVVNGRREKPARFGECAYIGDYSRTGVNAIFLPGIRCGWNCCIGPGVILGEDLPEQKMVLARQEQVQKEWGPHKYGW